MITINDLRIPPQKRGQSTAREEMRRASLHLETVVFRTARTTCNTGAPGYDMSLIEALKALRRVDHVALALVSDADQLLRSIGPGHNRSRARVTELLEDVVRVANALDEISQKHKVTQP